jgi:hypothetical protein
MSHDTAEVKVNKFKFAILTLLLIVEVEGCATSPTVVVGPAIPSGSKAQDSQLNVVLQEVISPGSQKAIAGISSWNEYVLRISNISDAPITLRGIRLITVQQEELHSLSSVADLFKETTQSFTSSRASTGRSYYGLGALSSIFPLAGLAASGMALKTIASSRTTAATVQEGRDEAMRRAMKVENLAISETAAGSVFLPVVPAPKELLVEYVYRDKFKQLKLELQ